MKPWLVIKFGGTSVSGRSRWQKIITIINKHQQNGFRVMLVHSAFSGITDALEKITNGETEQPLQFITQRLTEMATELDLAPSIFAKPIDKLQALSHQTPISDFRAAEIMAWGELTTHQMCLAFLQRQRPAQSFDPTTKLISSDNDLRNHRSQILSAKCQVQADPLLSEQMTADLYLMPGFIAANPAGKTVVLGRSGSDTSAAYMAAILQAKRLEIWSDVHGIFSTNPHHNPNARLLLHLGYQEAREIAASGGAVLHPRCILPVEQQNIPLHIKNTEHPQAAGTILSNQHQTNQPTVYAINSRHQVTLVSVESLNMWHQAGFLANMFERFKELGLSIDLISTAQSNVTVSLDSADNMITDPILNQLKQKLEPLGQVKITKNCSAVTLVGHRIRALSDKFAGVIASFSDHRIHITSQSSNDLNQTLVVDEDQANKLSKALHDALIGDKKSDIFGSSWQQLQQQSQTKQKTQAPWWQTERQQLLAIGEQHSPCYIYHLPTITQQIDRLRQLTAVDKIFYACKANSHPTLLQLMRNQGLGLETVSPNETQRVIENCGEDSKNHILFTPNFAPKQEYQNALAQNLLTTVDNPFILQQWGEIFSGKQILLRLDPGHGSGHHRYVRTAGKQSKFGIPENQIAEVAEHCRRHNIIVKGLHAHSGSGILEPQNWQRIVEFLTAKLPLFPTADTLNIGGGIGIEENPGDQGLDLKTFNHFLKQFKKQHPNIQIWIEPGRFLVAHSGILLAKVTQTKWKDKQGYVGIETGMNSLIRPALYGAWHNIVNLSRLDQAKQYTANIVGPMCESGDILGIDRHLPDCQSGDLMLIANTGAYGYSMASQYNLRSPAKQIIFPT